MQEFAAQPNTAVKISGIGVVNIPWNTEENEAIIIDTINIFGANRCMFGSNFPVDSLCDSFDTIFQNFGKAVSGLSTVDQSALFHKNAQKFYTPL
jgi:predicted TIM-barrel fold metal-dependent hydrolase